MPWKETDPLKERTKLILEWERRWKSQQGRVDVAELCRVFQVARPTAYRWINRYRDANFSLEALENRSSRPMTQGRAAATG